MQLASGHTPAPLLKARRQSWEKVLEQDCNRCVKHVETPEVRVLDANGRATAILSSIRFESDSTAWQNGSF
jgi:hypothetical protein